MMERLNHDQEQLLYSFVLMRQFRTTRRFRVEWTALEHDPEKWVPVFGKRSCSNKG
jgi:hypothetical protein